MDEAPEAEDAADAIAIREEEEGFCYVIPKTNAAERIRGS